MPPPKRPRQISDDSEQEDKLPATSSRNGTKRQRTISDQSEADDEERSLQELRTPGNSKSDDGEGDRESEEESDDDNEEDEEAIEASTQRVARAIERKSKNTRNSPADFGIVTSIELENFMCHSHLEVKLGPLINFVIGHNGSGKSAILTGLTLCLGGKATSTNRGSSLKSFIKEGQNQARITVKLKNGGDGYRPDVYGDIIIVERSFTREGNSSYKLKSKAGRLISNKREELDEICDYMGLQVDNPMNVLTQDAARQFINNSSEKEKYKFFVKGVQLEQLHQDYRLLIDSIANAEATLETKRSHLDAIKKQWEEAKYKLQLCKGQKEIHQKLTQLSQKMAWLQVQGQEKLLAEKEAQVKACEDKIRRLQAKLAESDEIYNQAQVEKAEADARLAAQVEKERPIHDELEQVKDKFDSNKKELLEIQHDQRGATAQVQATMKRIAELDKKIEDENKRLRDIDGGSNSRLVAKKEETIRERDEIVRKTQALESEFPQEQARLLAAKEATRKIKDQIDQKLQEIRDTRRKAEELRNVQEQYMTAYGRKMPELLRRIEEEGRKGKWREKPIGPLGQHIKLLKGEWSSILETIFGKGISGFLVTNYDDQSLLRGLMNQYDCDFPISICKNIDIRLREPDNRYQTILTVLEISNPLIRNHLVIQHNIEQTLLFEDQEEANAAWATVTEANTRNITVCIAKNQGRKGWGLRIGGGRIGANIVRPIRPWNGPPRMMTDLTTHMRQIQADLQNQERELSELKKALEKKDQIVAEIDRSLRSFDLKKRNLRVEKQRLDDQIERYNDEIEENVADSRLGIYESQREVLLKEKESEEKVATELVSRRMLLNEEQTNLRRTINEYNQQLDQMRELRKQLDEELHQTQMKRSQALINKNYWHEKIESEKQALEGCRDGFSAQERVVQEFTRKASLICPRIVLEPGATEAKFGKIMQKLTKELEDSEKRIGGSTEEITRACETATKNWLNAKDNVFQIENLLKVMDSTYKERTFRWRKFRKYISVKARGQFMWLMSQRGYRGRLYLDHQSRELKLEVQPSQQESDTGRGPRTLSGGERSFSTVCLLLALWEAMGSPIRCLDEFDVFMDSVNRTISVKMMIEAAQRSAGRQFILITPQDMSSINRSTDVKITRLRDPERNQSSLDRQIARG